MPITQDRLESVVKAARSCFDTVTAIHGKAEEEFKRIAAGEKSAERAFNDFFSWLYTHGRPDFRLTGVIGEEEQKLRFTRHRNVRGKLRQRAKRAGLPTRSFPGYIAGADMPHGETYEEVAHRVPEAQQADVLTVTSTDVPPEAGIDDLTAAQAYAAQSNVKVEAPLPNTIATKSLGVVTLEEDPKALKPGEELKLKL